MMSSGTSPFVRCTCSATGPDLVLGEAAERVGDELEVVGEVRRPGAVLRALVGERFEERGIAVRGDERRAPARARAGSTPQRLSRPISRVAMSAIASATYGRASIDSISPCSPYAHITREPSTAAAACARSYATTWCSSSFATEILPSSAARSARSARGAGRRRRPRVRRPRPRRRADRSPCGARYRNVAAPGLAASGLAVVGDGSGACRESWASCRGGSSSASAARRPMSASSIDGSGEVVASCSTGCRCRSGDGCDDARPGAGAVARRGVDE